MQLARFYTQQGDNNVIGTVWQRILVEKNTNYILKFYVFASSANQAWYNGIRPCVEVQITANQGYYANTTDEVVAKVKREYVTQDYGKWNEVTLEFNSGDHTELYLQFETPSLPGPSAMNDTYPRFSIDNVIIEATVNGDINGDGSTDDADLLMLKQILLGIDLDASKADVNNDTNIDICDLVTLKKLL